MSSRSRNFGLASLLIVCSAVSLSMSCSSANKKKVVDFPADGGAAGEAGSAGAPVGPGDAGAGGAAAGAGGAPSAEAGAGGAAGAEFTPEAGAGGVPGEGGSAGAVQATACVPSGTVTGASFGQLSDLVCPGATIQTFFNGNAPADFTCCGAFESVSGAFAISGITNMDGGGNIKITVPADAPLGAQNLSVSCPGSDALSASLNIVNRAVVTGIDASVYAGNTLTITGTDFDTVSGIALKDGEVTRSCAITSKTATTLTCIPQFTGLYWAELTQGACYPAANTALKVNVLPPT